MENGRAVSYLLNKRFGGPVSLHRHAGFRRARPRHCHINRQGEAGSGAFPYPGCLDARNSLRRRIILPEEMEEDDGEDSVIHVS